MNYFSITIDFEAHSPVYNTPTLIDIKQQLIDPAEKLIQIANAHGVYISFLLEVAEFFRFSTEEKYSFDLLCGFLDKAYAAGNDIQMHGHSEWATAKKVSDGYWSRMFTHPDFIHQIIDQFFDIYDKSEIILHSLLGDKWKPLVWRAGAYKVDPIEVLFTRLKDREIIADTSRHTLEFGKYWREGYLLELPILGTFPTTDTRWDINLSNRSVNYCFEHPESVLSGNKDVPLIMIGHSKMKHDWESLDKMFIKISKDTRFFSVKVSDLALRFFRDMKNLPAMSGCKDV
jgi:hypothetical protein